MPPRIRPAPKHLSGRTPHRRALAPSARLDAPLHEPKAVGGSGSLSTARPIKPASAGKLPRPRQTGPNRGAARRRRAEPAIASDATGFRIRLTAAQVTPPCPPWVTTLLTEQEVSRSWHKLFNRPEFTGETFAKAEALIEELRPESPLRHRLGSELEELRRMSGVESA